MKKVFFYIQLGFMLGMVCGIAALALSVTYSVTRDRVELQKQRDIMDALPVVLPGAQSFSDQLHKDGIDYYEAKSGDTVIGYALYGEAQGYQSTIKFMVGLDTKGTITGLRILEQAETPGLGARITELPAGQTLVGFIKNVFSAKKIDESQKEPWFPALFRGKDYRTIYVTKTEAGPNAIAAITGATITSDAVVQAVKSVSDQFLKTVK
ncbi:MAG: FMN-binding protein [Candidatus Auribacter fodinae]|jgi:electron transport complex protein RnfG|uniref:Ion-translocating oxidoreductase complex subunit G n=1 Tax=Candidatus Auribacter fodinae TaxID=2093366 RepID=A0A3A4QZ60_9BACT|nr:MAG: FMN-binding protein [Candidatus Auribacter fodinae]